MKLIVENNRPAELLLRADFFIALILKKLPIFCNNFLDFIAGGLISYYSNFLTLLLVR
jgi:hypothetical protein